MSVSGIKKWLAGTSEPGRESLVAISQATSVSVEWLALGRPISAADVEAETRMLKAMLADTPHNSVFANEHERERAIRQRLAELSRGPQQLSSAHPPISAMDENFVLVPRYDIRASAGAGSVIHSERVVDYLAFKRDWVRRALGVPPEVLALLEAWGDSMEPTIFHGDLVLLNTAVSAVKDDAIYALNVEGDLVIKRIQRHLDGSLTVKSDNPKYEPERISAGRALDLRIVGQHIWRAGIIR